MPCYPDENAPQNVPSLECTGYRIPTRAEWSYAARAGSRAATHDPLLDEFCKPFNGPSSVTLPSTGPNPWGLHDTLGNAWEFIHGREFAPVIGEGATDPASAGLVSAGVFCEGADPGTSTAYEAHFPHGGTRECDQCALRPVRTLRIPAAD